MLTRNAIHSGEYLQCFDTMPVEILWNKERIDESRKETMQRRPNEGDVWVFAYGSLMWNSLLSIAESSPATLPGWHRSFCLRTIAGRGTASQPGRRMLSLEPGGEVVGLAHRLSEATVEEELRVLWIREMPAGAYQPTWVRLNLDDGRDVHALAFVAEPIHPLYEKETSVETIAPTIAIASGPLGSNADYVIQLKATLKALGKTDALVDRLVNEIKRISRVSEDPVNT